MEKQKPALAPKAKAPWDWERIAYACMGALGAIIILFLVYSLLGAADY